MTAARGRTKRKQGNNEPSIEKLQKLHAEVKAILPRVAQARRAYGKSESSEDLVALREIEAAAATANKRFATALIAAEKALAIPAQVMEKLNKPNAARDPIDRTLRAQLTASKVKTTGWIDHILPSAIEALSALFPKADYKRDKSKYRLTNILQDGAPLSLTKGLRVESEFPTTHRLSQSLAVASDYLEGSVGYDHFAGATVIPQLVQLAAGLNDLRDVGGNWKGRLGALSACPSKEFDARLFELLVATACVRRGRNIEFVKESSDKSPDLYCHDPIPLAIECKRKAPLSDYEQKEEKAMRGIFEELEALARRRGVQGRFDLCLSVEAHLAPREEVVERLVSQRLAPNPARALSYAWGTTAFHPLTHRVHLAEACRPYSSKMLSYVFGWNADLPQFDGIVCRLGLDDRNWVSMVTRPVALAWVNESRQALNKRAWGPVDLFGDAVNQIPPGEFAMVYVAYTEGAREVVADRRTKAIVDRIKKWEHSAKIRIPALVFNRLYPRALDNGNPDLIESCLTFLGAEEDPSYFESFPTLVYSIEPMGERSYPQ